MLGPSCHLQVQCCEERGLPVTAGQLRSCYWDLPVAHKSLLAKHWPCHSPCAWTLGHDLSVYQGSNEKNNTRKPKSIDFKRAAALLATGERNVTSYVGVSKKHCPRLWRVPNCVADKWSNRTCGIWCNALDPFEVDEKICSGRSTERCTWLGIAICLMPKYQGSTSRRWTFYKW